MSGATADIVGLTGSAIFIVAFAYANWVPMIDKRLFNAANLVGAVLLLLSLRVHFNLAAMVLESMWGVIALIGLIAALRGPRGRVA